MVMMIIHIAYITCLITYDAWHAYNVIGVYKIHHGAGRTSYFAEPAILWLADTVMSEVGPTTFNGASSVMGEVEAHSRVGHAPWPIGQYRWSEKILYLLINRRMQN